MRNQHKVDQPTKKLQYFPSSDMQGQLWGMSIYSYKGLQCFRKIHLGEERRVKVICLFSWKLSALSLSQNFQVGPHT